MFHRECGVLKTSYEADMAFYPLPVARWTVGAIAVFFFLVLPLVVHEYYLSIVNLASIAVVGALGLNILVGYTGQISIGHGAFMSVGAYTAANFAVRLGAPFWIALPAGGLMAAFVGGIVGIPSLRIKGLYLAIATLAGQLIIEWTINHVTWISGGVQASIEVPRPDLFGYTIATQRQMYFFLLVFVVLAIVGTMNLVRSRIGRAFIAIRDQDIAAEIIGINIFRYKLLAFAIGTFYAGIAGALIAHQWRFVNTDYFPLMDAVWYMGMLVVGGMGSNLGPIFGAVVYRGLAYIVDSYFPILATMVPWGHAEQFATLGLLVYAVVIILFLIFEPRGLAHRWHIFKAKYRLFPFSY
ncbi:MAG: branched-chain amino acid ABC transporter permease [Candidatus Rokubacteria bacterium]|nr:branched-chain amino acid ABC transporter permease [Candidatus Rokubacteria bacterium]